MSIKERKINLLLEEFVNNYDKAILSDEVRNIYKALRIQILLRNNLFHLHN